MKITARIVAGRLCIHIGDCEYMITIEDATKLREELGNVLIGLSGELSTIKEWPCSICGNTVPDPHWWMRTTICEKCRAINVIVAENYEEHLEQ